MSDEGYRPKRFSFERRRERQSSEFGTRPAPDDDDDKVFVGDATTPRSVGAFTFEQVKAMIEQIKQETLEYVDSPSTEMQTEFGFGMVHGQIRAAKRLEQLLDNALRGQHLAEERFDRD